MGTSTENFEQLQNEFEENLHRCLNQNEIDFLHWLSEKIPDNLH